MIGGRGGTSVRIEGDEELVRTLDALEERLQDFRPVFRGYIDKSITLFFRRQFASAGVFGGEPWAPLRPATKRARARPGGNRGGLSRPLWDTSGLRSSFVNPASPTALRVITPKKIERGSVDPKAALHQEGFTVRKWGRSVFRNPRRVPARPIIPETLPRHITRSWLTIIGDYLMGKGPGPSGAAS